MAGCLAARTATSRDHEPPAPLLCVGRSVTRDRPSTYVIYLGAGRNRVSVPKLVHPANRVSVPKLVHPAPSPAG